MLNRVWQELFLVEYNLTKAIAFEGCFNMYSVQIKEEKKEKRKTL